MISDEDYILIERYLQGDLAAAELSAFENRMATDMDFSKEVQLMQSMNDFAPQKHKTDQTIEQFIAFGQKFNGTATPEPKPTTPILESADSSAPPIIPIYKQPRLIMGAIVAAAALLLLCLLPQFTNNTYDQYYQYRPISTEKNTSQPNLNQAVQFFNQEQYQKAVPALEPIATTDPSLQLALGISYMETNQHSKANQTFIDLIKNHPIYQNEGHWYLALNALRQKDITTCRQWLNQIDSDSVYGKKAKQLKEKI